MVRLLVTRSAQAGVLGVHVPLASLEHWAWRQERTFWRRVQSRRRLRAGPSPLSRAVVHEVLMELEGRGC